MIDLADIKFLWEENCIFFVSLVFVFCWCSGKGNAIVWNHLMMILSAVFIVLPTLR